MLRFMDIFLVEGCKATFRLALSLLQLISKKELKVRVLVQKASFLSSIFLQRSNHRINQLSTSVIGSDRLKLMVECNQIKDFGPIIFFSKASGYHVP